MGLWNRSKLPESGRRRRRWPVALLLLALTTGGFFAFYPYPPLPTAEVARARVALAEARTKASGVKEFAKQELERAEGISLQLELLYAMEAAKPLRFFEPLEVKRLAGELEQLAKQAVQKSRQARTAQLQALQDQRADVETQLRQLGAEVQFFSRDKNLRRSYGRAELAVMEARKAQSRGEVKPLATALERAATELSFTEKMLGNRYQRLRDPAWQRRWQAWVDDTIASSRGGGLAIVIEKLGRRLCLLRGGKVVAEFPAEFGRNGLSDKLHAGDGATPEGRYFVKEKRGHGATRWYRALVLDYPNAEDWRRFQAARRAGQISSRYSIGGLIEIHGNGGKRKDWTDGCVALRNAAIDRVFAQVPVGTPVTIVGSARLPGDGAASLVSHGLRAGGTR